MPSTSPTAGGTPQALPRGTRLGRYELLERLAIGGMAEIYLARTEGIEGFQKQVVLKRILPQLASDEYFVSMFLREARLAATLQHPNIVQVYDIGLADESHFFTMEYVSGVDARMIFRRTAELERAIPLEHAIGIVLGATAGLHHAHEQRGADGKPLAIVHRDVSPSNILVSDEGCAKVADFGIAKAAAERSETQSGSLKGKIAYMSPEQCRGEPLDRRSDLFSLGVVLYELTTGSRLFQYDSDFATMTAIVSGQIASPSSVQPGYPPELEAILLKALRTDRQQRYSSLQGFQLELEAFVRDRRIPVSSVALSTYLKALFPERERATPSDNPTRTASVGAAERTATTLTDRRVVVADEDRAPEGRRVEATRSRRVYFVVGGALVAVAAGVGLMAAQTAKRPAVVPVVVTAPPMPMPTPTPTELTAPSAPEPAAPPPPAAPVVIGPPEPSEPPVRVEKRTERPARSLKHAGSRTTRTVSHRSSAGPRPAPVAAPSPTKAVSPGPTPSPAPARPKPVDLDSWNAK